MVAADGGHIDIARRLLRHGSARNAMRDKTTPLHLAAESGHVEMIELLLGAGAYVNRVGRGPTSVHRGARYGWTPLFNAAHGGHPEAITTLLAAGADVHHMAYDGSTALMRAITSRDQSPACIRRLLAAGARVNHANYFGETALHAAVRYGRPDLVQLLIEAGADVHATYGHRYSRNYSGPRDMTALCLAACIGNVETVETLLEGGANVDHKTFEGETALNLARKYHNDPAATVRSSSKDHMGVIELLSRFADKD